jgi:hypothetical protein
VILRGGIRLPAEITEVVAGRSWSWRVGGIVVHHIVTPAERGSRLSMPVNHTARLWAPAAVAYTPLVALIARRIARAAEDGIGGD